MNDATAQTTTHDIVEEAMLLRSIFDLPAPKDLSLGLLCRIYRAKAGLKIEQAADAIGITRQLLSEIEDGKVPQKGKIKKIADHYGDGFKLALQLIKLA